MEKIKKQNLLRLHVKKKFINLVMKNGKKSKAYTILYKAFKLLYLKNLHFFVKSVKNKNTKDISGSFLNNLSQFKYKSFIISKKVDDGIKVLPFSNEVNKIKKNEGLKDNTGLKDLKENSLKVKKISIQKEKPIILGKKTTLIEKKFFSTRKTNKPVKQLIFTENLVLQAIENVQPSVEVRSVKVSGRSYQVPAIVSKKRQQVLAMKWIIDSARKKQKSSNNDFSECLAIELFEALKASGKVKQKKDFLHQQAESNRAYMRFKWW